MNRITDYKKLAEDISNWIKDYTTTNNIKSLVVGVSGGIDSAVVSTLCAMTGLPTYILHIDIWSSQESADILTHHTQWLTTKFFNCTFDYCSLSIVFDKFKDTFVGNHHVWANTKSRLRMTALYQIAGYMQGIVVGTGNKVEDFGIGFYTKYGDGGVDISPIADLYKTEVRELGRYLGISEEILNAVPTDGLWSDGRTDEDQIGCTYEELEWAMEDGAVAEWINGGDGPEEDGIALTDRQREVLRIYHHFNDKNQHKMKPIPTFKLNQ